MAVLSSKKRKVKASLVLKLTKLKINDDKLTTTDTSNIKGESEIRF